MIDKIDCLDVTLKWNDGNNDDVIYLSIIDDVFYYNNGTYKSNYKLSEIGMNFRMLLRWQSNGTVIEVSCPKMT